MKSMSARYAILLVALVFICLALACISYAISAPPVRALLTNVVPAGIVAGLVMLLANRGPLALAKNTMPMEARRNLLIAGRGLMGLGYILMISILILPSTDIMFNSILSWGLMLFATVLLAVALFGQIPFALSIPLSYKIGEVIQTLRSTGFSQNDGIANREMSKWTGKKRDGLKLGDTLVDAPLCTLAMDETSLEQVCNFDGITVLNFGSYTCPVHRRWINELLALFKNNQDARVQFATIYIAEAHPVDGWKIPGNFREDEEYTGDEDDFCIKQPTSMEERCVIAKRLVESKNFNWPVYLDTMKNTALHAYNSWPIRLYMIENGKVIYAGAQGPFGYKPDELEAALRKRLARM